LVCRADLHPGTVRTDTDENEAFGWWDLGDQPEMGFLLHRQFTALLQQEP